MLVFPVAEVPVNKPTKPNQTRRLQGIVVLTGFAVLSVIGNASVAPLAANLHPRDPTAILIWLIAGVICAQVCVLCTWLVLGDGSLVNRIIVVFLAMIAASSAWAFGGALTLSMDQSFRSQPDWKLIFLLGLIPSVVFGMSLPLMVLRFFFSRRLIHESSLLATKAQPNAGRFSIGQLLIVTALVAIIGGGVELSNVLIQPAIDRWLVAGAWAAVACGLSLLIVIPFVVGLMRDKGLYFWLAILPIYVVVLAASTTTVLSLIDSNGRRWIPRRLDGPDAAAGFTIIIVGVSLVVVFIGLRLVNYRLIKISRER